MRSELENDAGNQETFAGSAFALFRQRRRSSAASTAPEAGVGASTHTADDYYRIANKVLIAHMNNAPDRSENDFDCALQAARTAAEMFEKEGRVDEAKIAWGLIVVAAKDPVIKNDAQDQENRLGAMQPRPLIL